MRLVDKVAQGPRQEMVAAPEHSGVPRAGAGALAAEVGSTALRYVLDRAASRQCAEIFCTAGALPRVDALIARLPSPCFWMELFGVRSDAPGAVLASGRRLGYLVDAAQDCRSGRIDCFAEDSEGRPRLLGASVLFDLDRPIDARASAGELYPLRHAALPAVDEMLHCARREVRDDFARHARVLARPYRSIIAELAESVWCALPAVLSFSALLNARSALDEKSSALASLNAARARRGKPPLLDHV